MALVDFYQYQSDLKTILAAGPSTGFQTTPQNVFIEAMERETTFSHMPFVNVRLPSANIELRSIPNGYYALINYEVDIVCFDMSHFQVAAQARDNLLADLMLAVQENRQFSANIETSIIGSEINFGAGVADNGQGHVAAVTFTVAVEVYVDAPA